MSGPYYDCNKCGDVQTFTPDDLKEHRGKTWCATCWFYHMEHETGIEYIDLPPFVPESERKIQTLTEGLESIKRHMELSKTGTLSNVWHIADAALTKTEGIGK